MATGGTHSPEPPIGWKIWEEMRIGGSRQIPGPANWAAKIRVSPETGSHLSVHLPAVAGW